MYYWNKDNFESLSQLALHLRGVEELYPLAEYCELREKGLRKQALNAVRAFLQTTQSMPDDRKLELAIYLLELHWNTPAAHQFLTQPVLNDFILPSLRKNAQPVNQAFRFLALLQAEQGCSDKERQDLEKVLEHDPADATVRSRLIVFWLGLADFAMHHLHESCFIGSEAECHTALAKAASLLDHPEASREYFAGLAKEQAELAKLLNLWTEYKTTRTALDFPTWCTSKGQEVPSGITVYYS